MTNLQIKPKTLLTATRPIFIVRGLSCSSTGNAQMVKLVDTPASGVGDASRGGSSPLLGTKQAKPRYASNGAFCFGGANKLIYN